MVRTSMLLSALVIWCGQALADDNIDGGSILGYRAIELLACPNMTDGPKEDEPEDYGIVELMLQRSSGENVRFKTWYTVYDGRLRPAYVYVTQRDEKTGEIVELFNVNIRLRKFDLNDDNYPIAVNSKLLINIADAAVNAGCGDSAMKKEAYLKKLRENGQE